MPPRKAKEIVQAKIRIAADVQSQLEAAAKKHKISYNAEAAGRLAKSLAEEAFVGGEEGRQRLHSITNAFVFAGTNAAGGRKLSSWISEPKAYSAAMLGVIEALMIGQPEVTLEKCQLQIEFLKGTHCNSLLEQGKNTMTGHIRRRGKQSWELKFDAGIDPTTGKRKTRYASFKGNKRDAQIELTRLIAEHNAGLSIDPSKMTVKEFLERWDRDHATLNCTPKTLERYRQVIKNQLTPNIGAVVIQKLRPVQLAELYSKLQTGGLAPRTVGHCHRLLHRALGHAATWGIIQANVAASVKPPRIDQAAAISILEEDQIGRVLRHLEGRTLRPIVALALASGARRGELLALRLKDFKADDGTIRIERSLEQTKAGLRFKSPKTKHGRRTISLPPAIVAELRAHLLRQQERRLALGMGRSKAEDLLFARWDGRTRSPHWLTQKFGLTMEALKIEGVTLHSLRHTHASQLIAAGMDVLTISRRLGHGSPTITLSTYGHLFRNTDSRAAEILEATFAKLKP